MIMEFVEGVTLEKRAGQAALSTDEVLSYAAQVLAALSYAHARGVIHRDLKPANMMVTGYGVLKLMDFGIAKSSNELQLTRPGTTMGSVYYMSPEQVSGGTVDARSDIYSLGVTLYELLTGRKPFQADTAYSVLNAQLNTAPQPPIELNSSLPPGLNDIILTSLAKDPAKRFQTADAFRNALRSLPNATAPLNERPSVMPFTSHAHPSADVAASAQSAIAGGPAVCSSRAKQQYRTYSGQEPTHSVDCDGRCSRGAWNDRRGHHSSAFPFHPRQAPRTGTGTSAVSPGSPGRGGNAFCARAHAPTPPG